VAANYTNVQGWAKHNSMIVHLSKRKQIIFYNFRAIPIPIPPSIFDIKQVTSVKLLGVYTQKFLVVISILNTSTLFRVRDFIY